MKEKSRFWPQGGFLNWFSPSPSLLSPTTNPLFSSVSLFLMIFFSNFTSNSPLRSDFSTLLPVLILLTRPFIFPSVFPLHFSFTWRYFGLSLSCPLSLYRSSHPLCPCLRLTTNKWVIVCQAFSNTRLNCGLTPLCLSHWLPGPASCSLRVQWCNETAYPNTHSYPGIHSLRHTEGCTCAHSHRHWLTPSPELWAYKPRQQCVRSITDEV